MSTNEVHDRIDFIYHRGAGVVATDAFTLGLDAANPNTDVAVTGYNADHRAVVVTFEVPDDCFLVGDLDESCTLDAADWTQFRSGQHVDLAGLTQQQAYALGDLNGDLLNNHADFALFKAAYERTHGAGSFAALIAGVPEPSTCLLALVTAGLALFPRRRFNQGNLPIQSSTVDSRPI